MRVLLSKHNVYLSVDSLTRLTSILSSRFILNLRWACQPQTRASDIDIDSVVFATPRSSFVGVLGQPLARAPWGEDQEPDSHADPPDNASLAAFTVSSDPFGA